MTRPFFEQPGFDASRPRLLLLSWHFPPGTAAGALRWQKLAGHLAAAGWQLDAVTASPDILKERDDRRLAELPAGTRVWGVAQAASAADAVDRAITAWRARGRRAAAAGAPGSGAKSSGTAEKTLAFEDVRWSLGTRPLKRTYTAWLEWSRDAAWSAEVASLAKRLGTPATRAVVSCGPPHMVHQAGWHVGAALRLPSVMDLRDPWSLPRRVPEPLASPLWFELADRHERRAVAHAALVVANTDALAAGMRARHPAANIIAVMNGFDVEPMPAVERPAKFILAYAGAVYLDRDPRPLLKATAMAVARLGVTPEQLGIEVIGNVGEYEGVSLPKIADAEGVGAYFTAGGRVPRTEALAFLARAAMLVSLPQDSRYAIPSKIFEYMQFPAWLLALSDDGTPTADLLAGSGADVLRPGDVEGIARAIETRYHQYVAGVRPERLSQSLPHLARTEQAAKLIAALEQLPRPR